MEKKTKKKITWVTSAVLVTALTLTLLANFARPEKKLEHTLSHRYTVDEPQFRREMGVMLGPPITYGNEVIAYNNGDEIFPPMIDAIESAKHTINFETYVYWSGDIGEKFAESLAQKAREGVKVNVIIDWVGGLKMDPVLVKTMTDAGARVKMYRPLHWYNLGRLNNRTHRKLLIVDGKTGFTGGVGIADEWSGNAQDPNHWRDMHFEARGPVVAQIQAAFNDNWMKATGEVLNGELYFPPLKKEGDIDAHMFISSPQGGSESMHLMYLLAIAASNETLDIHASYFVPDELTMKALVSALRRGVKIRILVPGEHIDSETVRIASKKLWGELLKHGAEIYEYKPTMMHVKSLIVDKYMVSVGSTNFDVRSFQLNDEASMNVYDADFAVYMTEVFENDLKQAQKYDYNTWKKRPFRQKFMEGVVIPLRSQL